MTLINPISTLKDSPGQSVVDIDASLAAAVSPFEFRNDGSVILFVSNGAGTTTTLTVSAQPDAIGRDAAGNDLTVAIPTTKMGFVPFLNPTGWNSGGQVFCSLSQTASVKIGVYRLLRVR